MRHVSPCECHGFCLGSSRRCDCSVLQCASYPLRAVLWRPGLRPSVTPRWIVGKRSCTKDKTGAPDVANERGLIWPVDLATQLSHVDVDEIGFRYDFVIPDFPQDRRARQQRVALFHHVPEQLKFARPQVDPAVAALCGAIQEIELQRSNAQHDITRLRSQAGEVFPA